MAQKSRKHSELAISVSKDTVGYIRLSVLNRDYHGSVGNQRLMIEEWGRQQHIPIIRYYIDGCVIIELSAKSLSGFLV
jgi:hypothetical protein